MAEKMESSLSRPNEGIEEVCELQFVRKTVTELEALPGYRAPKSRSANNLFR
jgi:hypothetical protein